MKSWIRFAAPGLAAFMVPLLAACAWLVTPILAQNAAGKIAGVVTDPGGSSIGGATVTVTNVATTVTSKTSTEGDGRYQVLDLPIGNYTVQFQCDGFATTITQPNELQINQTLRIDARLTVGSLMQTVAVSSQAAQVETEVPTVGGTVSGTTIQNLPLNGRNTLDLALTLPGVVPAPPSTNPFLVSNITIAGGRPDSIGYLLDGANNTSVNTNAVVLNPNPDMIAEFRILANNYTAEFGRGGGGIVSVVTKSGTNQLHGSLYDYLRNEDFNASDYFSNQAGLPRPVLKRNQFGGTLGGPVVVPKIVHGKDRLFFYFGYQGQRQSQKQVGAEVTVYTPGEINGDFSHSSSGGPDPNVAAFLQANPYFQSDPTLASQAIMDPAKINAVSANYIKAGLIPSSASGIQVPHGSASDNRNEYTGKIDYALSTTDHLTATIGYANGSTLIPFGAGGANVVGYPDTNQLKTRTLTVGYSKTFSPTLVNEARATVARYLQNANHPALSLPTTLELGTDIISDLPFGPAILTFASGINTGFNVNGPTKFSDTNYSYDDTLTRIEGRHTFKGGFTFGANQNNSIFAYDTNGQFYFSGPNGIGSGNDLADFLFGLPDQFYQLPQAKTDIRTKSYWAFFQDEWKVTHTLQLTMGLRYEYTTPLADTKRRTYTYVAGLQSQRFVNSPLGLVIGGDPGAPTGEFFPDKNNFAPRLGFAWDPFGNGRTSVRGGFGVFFDGIKGFSITWANGTAPLWPAIGIYPSAASGPITGEVPYMAQPYQSTGTPNPFPSTPPEDLPKTLNFADEGYLPFGLNQVSTSSHLRTPYIYQYNLSLQRQLGTTLVAEVNYVANSSHKELAQSDIDPMILGTDVRVINTLPGVANQCGASNCYTHFNQIQNIVNGNYNGLLTSLTKRTGDWHSLGATFFTVSYTWSHMLDDASSWLGSRTNGVPAYNPRQFYGNSDYDIRQRVVVSGGWEMPFDNLWADGPRLLTSGWSLFPILSRQSGQPLDVYANLPLIDGRAGPSGAGDPDLVRANLAGSSVQFYEPSRVRAVNGATGNFYFDPNSFAPNPTNWNDPSFIPSPGQRTYGTYRRNSVVGPGFTNLDLSLEKRMALFQEKLQLAFRVEGFNVLNHPEFWVPDTSPTSGTFGQITSVNPSSPSRIVQLALRLQF